MGERTAVDALIENLEKCRKELDDIGGIIELLHKELDDIGSIVELLYHDPESVDWALVGNFAHLAELLGEARRFLRNEED